MPRVDVFAAAYVQRTFWDRYRPSHCDSGLETLKFGFLVEFGVGRDLVMFSDNFSLETISAYFFHSAHFFERVRLRLRPNHDMHSDVKLSAKSESVVGIKIGPCVREIQSFS